MSGHLHVFETPQELAVALADAFVHDAACAIAERGTFFVALAGGTTPKAAYELLGAAPRKDAVAWDRVQIFFGDERCVGPEDPDSNYRMARDAFLQRTGIPDSNVHRMRGEDDPAQAARDYADVLITVMGADPRFDLVLLGMGADGHTASLFPGSDPYTDAEQLVRSVWAAEKRTYRITLTPAVINSARHVIIATEGTGKARMLRTVRESRRDPLKYPVQCVAPENGALDWYVDRAAASEN